MAARRGTTNIWVIFSVVATVMTFACGFVWSIIQGQVNDNKADLAKYKEDSRWQYATKDYVNGQITGIKDEEKTFRWGLERKGCQ